MPIIIKLQDIDQALENLNYKSETTLKSKLIRAVRNCYEDENAIEATTSIDTEKLVKLVWETGEDQDLIKAKRKNFSSLKSSVNNDLKKLYAEGKNQQGIIIGHNNIFDISDEAKDRALASIIDIFKEKGIDTSSKITEILAALGDILSSKITSTSVEDSQGEIDRLKNILGGLSEKLDLLTNNVPGQSIAEGKASPSDNADAGGTAPALLNAADRDLSGTGAINVISTGDKGGALANITDILKDKNTDTASKLNQIATTINDMLSDAIISAGSGLSGTEASRIKGLLGGLAKKIEASEEGIGLAGKGEEPYLTDKTGFGADKDKLDFDENEDGRGLSLEGEDSSEHLNKNILSCIIDVLNEQGTEITGKIGKIISAVNKILSEAIDYAGTGLKGDEAQQLKGLFERLADKIESSLQKGMGIDVLGKELGLGDEVGIGSDGDKPGIGDTKEGLGESKSGKAEGVGDDRKSLSGIADILKDESTDIGDKIGKIMSAVNNILSEAIDAAGSGLSNEDAAKVKILFRGLAEKIQSILQGGISIDDLGKKLGLGDEAAIGKADDKPGLGKAQEGLGDADAGKGKGFGDDGKGSAISAEDKGKALTGIANTLKDEGTETAGRINEIANEINEMLTDTLNAAVTELSSKEAEGIKSLFDNLANKIKTSLHDGLGIDPVAENVALADQLQAAGITSEGVASGEFEIIEDIQEADSDELIEVVEEIIDDDYTTEGRDSLEGTETIGNQESLGEVAADEIDAEPDAGITERTLGADEIVEILEEIPADSTGQSSADGEMIADSSTAGETDKAPAEAQAGEGTGHKEAESPATQEEMPQSADDLIEGKLGADEIIGTLEEIPGEGSASSLSDGESTVGTDDLSAGTLDYEEVIEADDSTLETKGTQSGSGLEAEVIGMDGYEDVEIVEGLDGQENTYEPVSSQQDSQSAETLNISGGNFIDADLRDKTQILSELAQAAKALEKLGPDLSGTIYSEQEIKEKAKLLSEEFDRYLSIREKFYNQHILINGGDFLVGGSHFGKNELPEQIIKLNDFYIGKFPVTNAVFEIFVEKTGYVTTAEKYGYGLVYIPQLQKIKNHITGVEQFIWNNQLQCKKITGACWHHPSGPSSSLHVKRTHPVVQVSLEDACAFAAWTGKRIPTEKEWEAASRTPRGYLYPWGNKWKDNACNIETSLHGDTAPVDKYLAYANVSEVADTLGNVLEWTLDSAGSTSPDDESEEIYIVKGASWASDENISLTDRQFIEKNTSSNILGFRCIAI